MKMAYEPEDIELSRYEIIFYVSGDFHAEICKNVGGPFGFCFSASLPLGKSSLLGRFWGVENDGVTENSEKCARRGENRARKFLYPWV